MVDVLLFTGQNRGIKEILEYVYKQIDGRLDRGIDIQVNIVVKQLSDINIVVSRLMQEKKFFNIKI